MTDYGTLALVVAIGLLGPLLALLGAASVGAIRLGASPSISAREPDAGG
jgi:hypothetical protein